MSASHIFIIGFMGAGKSTVAAALAERLSLPCVDLDARVESRAAMSISRIFAEQGEDAFRELESEALAAVGDLEPSVVACGGGVVLRPENRARLKELGTVVYLKVTAGEALARVGDATTRPLLGGGGAALAGQLLQAREALYLSVSDVVVDTVGLTADEVTDAVAIALGRGGRP